MGQEISVKEAASLLLRQGRYQSASELLAGVTTSDTDYGAAQVLTVRLLLEQGRIGTAYAFVTSATQQPFAGEEVQRLRLWAAFVRLYGELAHASGDLWRGLEQSCADVLSDPSSGPSLRALAIDFRSRAMAWRISLGWEPPALRPAVVEEMGRVVEAYEEAGELREALTARRRLSGFCRGVLFADMTLARRLLLEVRREAGESGDLINDAEAALGLAEMDFEEALNADGVNLQPLINNFVEAAQLFARADHAFAEARVAASVARLLLQYGLEEGVGLAHGAIDAFTGAGEIILRQEAWKQLATWYTYHGDERGASEALEASRRLSEEMQFGLSSGVDGLAEADGAFRGGRVAQAREILDRARFAEQSQTLGASYRLITVNAVASLGLTDEAAALLRRLVADLREQGASVFLAQAWFLLAHAVERDDPAEARRCIDEAIQVDEELGDTQSVGQHLANRAWLEVLRRLRAGESPLVNQEVESDFDRAQALLLTHRTLEARVQLGSLFQMRGQAALFARLWDECDRWLNAAEALSEALKLGPQLAFTLTYQALSWIEVGRRAGVKPYDEALTRLAKAEEIFARAGLLGVLWRVVFYRGLCEYEAGRLEAPGSDEQRGRWERAKVYLEEAARQIDRLRGFADRSPAAQQQTTWIAFGVDKQTVYDIGFQLTWFWQRDSVAALTWLERMKGRALLDALADSVTQPSHADENELLAREQTLREKKRNTAAAAEALEVQKEIDSLLEQMSARRETAGYAALRRGEPAGWEQLRATLQREQPHAGDRRLVIAQFYCTPRQTLLFGMRADWSRPEVESLRLDYRALSDIAAHHFRKPDGVRMMLEDLGEAPWQQFSQLLSPLAVWASPDDIVCLIPHGVLHDLPLHTLAAGGVRLIERNPVFYCPSASILQYTLGRPGGSARLRGAVFGDSAENLPRSRDEAVAVADVLGVVARLGPAVTKEALLDALAAADVLHFAGHGELSTGNGLDTGLLLAGGDLLRAVDLLGATTAAELVVLSGCETGVSEQRVGDELVGLVRALLFAGAGSLLVSQWRVSDPSTLALLRAFYTHAFGERGVSKAEALRLATAEVRGDPRWRDFYHWGGFVLVGDWK